MGGLPWLRRRSALLGGRGEEWGTRGASSGARQPEEVGWGAEAAAELGDRTADRGGGFCGSCVLATPGRVFWVSRGATPRRHAWLAVSFYPGAAEDTAPLQFHARHAVQPPRLRGGRGSVPVTL